MLATRIDQENALKGFKAPKTPYKVPLNDENAPFRAGKSVLKTNGKGITLDKNFVTPAGKEDSLWTEVSAVSLLIFTNSRPPCSPCSGPKDYQCQSERLPNSWR
jgi:hypothetical protein